MYHTSISSRAFDGYSISAEAEAVLPHVFICDECPQPAPAYATSKGLACHKRKKHGRRTELRFFVDGSGVCPVCKTQLFTRLRVITHLSDKRYVKACRDAVASGQIPRLPEEEVLRLDDLDKLARRQAFRAGHTRVPAARRAIKQKI